jgi:hypothetical protein
MIWVEFARLRDGVLWCQSTLFLRERSQCLENGMKRRGCGGGSVAEAYTTQPNSKASSRVLYNIFESTCGGVTVITHV